MALLQSYSLTLARAIGSIHCRNRKYYDVLPRQITLPATQTKLNCRPRTAVSICSKEQQHTTASASRIESRRHCTCSCYCYTLTSNQGISIQSTLNNFQYDHCNNGLLRKISSKSKSFEGLESISPILNFHDKTTYVSANGATIDGTSIEELEKQLKILLKSNNNMKSPVPTEKFLVILRALAFDESSKDAHLRAEQWVLRLEKQYEEYLQRNEVELEDGYILDDITPTSECYTCVIRAWTNVARWYVNQATIVTRAERWIRKHMNSSVPAMRPNTDTFNAFLDVCTKGWGTRSSKNDWRNAANRDGNSSAHEHAKLAQSILMYMIDSCIQHKHTGTVSAMAPTIESFNYVIRGWTRCRHDEVTADRALRVLQLLEAYQNEFPHSSLLPDSRSYAMVMDAITIRSGVKVKKLMEIQQKNRHGHSQKDIRMMFTNPDRNGLSEIQLLEDLLVFMEGAQESKDTTTIVRNKTDAVVGPVQNSTISYNMLINCWAKLAPIHEIAPYEAEKVLNRMERFQRKNPNDPRSPDSISYLNVIRAWANSNHSVKGQRATFFLEKQWRDYDYYNNDIRMKPTVSEYNTIIQIWSKSRNPFEAERLLYDLLKRSTNLASIEKTKESEFDHVNNNHQDDDDNHHRHPQQQLEPDSNSFNLVMQAWIAIAANGSEHSLQKAAKWLKKLAYYEKNETTALKTATELYTSIIKASLKCVSSSVDPYSVYVTALETFNEFRTSHHTVDSLDYTRMLQVGLFALSKPDCNNERELFLQTIVQHCKDDGNVSSKFIQELSNGTIYSEGWTSNESAKFVELFFPTWPLPPSWSRNVVDQCMKPKRQDFKRQNLDIVVH